MTCTNCNTELPGIPLYCSDCGVAVSRTRVPPRNAGFWRRVGAVTIDLILFWPIIVILGHLLGIGPTQADLTSLNQLSDRISNEERVQQQLRFMLQFGYVMAFANFVLAPYYILMESSVWQGTLGKRILGLRVTDMNNKRIGLGKATLRYLARNLSAIPWQAGFVMAGFTARKQALHDILASTLVVLRRKAPDRKLQDSDPDW